MCRAVSTNFRLWAFPGSAPPVLREDIVSVLHDRVAPEPALGVVPLRRHVGHVGGHELTGRGVVLERTPSSSTAVREPLAVLHHEVDVMQRPGHRGRRERVQLPRDPMDLCNLGAVTGTSLCYHGDRDVDVAARRVRVRAHLVRGVDERPGSFGVDAR